MELTIGPLTPDRRRSVGTRFNLVKLKSTWPAEHHSDPTSRGSQSGAPRSEYPIFSRLSIQSEGISKVFTRPLCFRFGPHLDKGATETTYAEAFGRIT